MAAIHIKLLFNLQTGKKDIYIDFESDADALPIEHEAAHRAVVEKLLGQKVILEDEVGEVYIQRVAPQSGPATANQERGEGQERTAVPS